MFQVTFKLLGNNDLQIAYFEREVSAYGFIAMAKNSKLITQLGEIEFVMLSGM